MSPEELEDARRKERYTDYLRKTGRAIQVDPAPSVAHVQALYARGMTAKAMAEQTHLTRNMIGDLIRGRRTADKGGGPIKVIDRPDEASILAIKFVPPRDGQGAHLWAVGPRRRTQALVALGFPGPFLAQNLGVSNQRVHQILNRPGRVSARTMIAIADLYDKWSTSDPREVGLTNFSISRALGFAKANSFAPPMCWDPYTIDDPDAIPQWTGQCGTPFGWIIHQREDIPLCYACLNVADDFVLDGDRLRQLRERKGLSQERLAALAGIKVDAYRSWENGRTNPRYLEQLDRVLAVLDVTFEEVNQWPESSQVPRIVPRFGRKPTARTS